MATATEMRNSITPGSLPFGQRQAFEDALGNAGSDSAPSPAAAGAAATPGVPSNPLDILGSGEIPVNNDAVTAGLSVGPGPGPVSELQPPPDSKMERYRILATQPKSPVLRELARRALRGASRERARGF